ncbi:MAG: phosphoribosylaminoimidazolesuccinocarboxamide synthase [Pirellula sp.]|nr:phosphoribosylaminoimidazolesuccinocarboxamide synthase [Pirellula sp.]
MSSSVVPEVAIPSLPVRHGKVRDVYDLGERLLLVASDRISAFDWILPTRIPDKGRVLTQLSAWWFELLGGDHHLLSLDPATAGLPAGTDLAALAGRSMVVRKTNVVPVECVVRGYLSGSGWKEYQRSGTVCGITLPQGLIESDRLPEPIFTPATKAETGHDENISFQQMCDAVGTATADELRRRSIDVYLRGAEYALARGIIIADTKFEWGRTDDGRLILIDEVMTPDSSRFWPVDLYEPGHGQPSYDKQFVRDWLEQSGWDKNSPPPALPDDVVFKTRAKYVEAFERLTGRKFAW